MAQVHVHASVNVTVLGSIPGWGNEIFNICIPRFGKESSAAMNSITQHAVPLESDRKCRMKTS